MTEAEGLILFFLAWLRQSFPTTREPQLPRKQESMEMKEFPSFEKSSLKKPLKWALAGRRTEGYAIFLRSHDAGALSRRLKFKAICPNNDEKKRKEGKRLWFFRRQTQPFFFIVPGILGWRRQLRFGFRLNPSTRLRNAPSISPCGRLEFFRTMKQKNTNTGWRFIKLIDPENNSVAFLYCAPRPLFCSTCPT